MTARSEAQLVGLRAANDKRSRCGCAAQVGKARAQLQAHGSRMPSRLSDALTVRVESPNATLVELAAELGLTKDAYWRLLSRGIAWPERA